MHQFISLHLITRRNERDVDLSLNSIQPLTHATHQLLLTLQFIQSRHLLQTVTTPKPSCTRIAWLNSFS
uniref:Uncharacterized protein n=1 Tax=Parascaris univalens TaxID=6257 RepID=A0A915C5H4_PARUN